MRKIMVVTILVAMIFGCASTSSKISKNYVANGSDKISLSISKDPGLEIPEDQYQLMESQIRQGLSGKGLLASLDDKAQHSVAITLHSFRMRPDAARLTVGIMAGCDTIYSDVVVTSSSTNEEIGKSKISIKECAAWGVASQVIKKYTDGVVAYLSNKEGG